MIRVGSIVWGVRHHLDLYAFDQDDEVERSSGTIPTTRMMWCSPTPDGNRFCVVQAGEVANHL